MPTLTVTRAVLALVGLTVSSLQTPTLTPYATRALRPMLESQGFDLARPIRVRELDDDQGFRLTQEGNERP
jgi:hypothetical protein